MSVQIRLIAENGSTMYLDTIGSFRLVKEAYTPYSQLTALICSAFDQESIRHICRVQLMADETELHLGTADRVDAVRENGTSMIRVISRGLTAMLLQNQLTPGIHSRMSLDRLMTEFYSFPPEITWESSTDTSNYIYVKENTAMWDGITNLTYKLCGRYPFICGANEIRMHLPASYQTYYATDHILLAAGIVTDASRIYSDYYMADADGSYETFHEADAKAKAKGLVRTRQLALDRQYLYDPQEALSYRRKFSERGMIRRYVETNGILKMRLGDRLSYADILDGAPINRIVYSGSPKGTKTRLEAYEDAFYPEAE